MDNTGLTCFDVDKTGRFGLRYFNNYEHLEGEEGEEEEKDSLAVGNNLNYEGFTSMVTETEKSEITRRSDEMESISDNQPPEFEAVDVMKMEDKANI